MSISAKRDSTQSAPGVGPAMDSTFVRVSITTLESAVAPTERTSGSNGT